MKRLFLIFAFLWGANASAEQCLGKNFFAEFYCGQFTSSSSCKKNADCYWGDVNPDNQCNIWNGQEDTCSTLPQCEWSSGGCEGDSAFCRGSSRDECRSSDGCSWSSGQCHLRN